MGQWTDRIRNHRVWGILEAVGPSLDQALERQGLAPDAIDSIERLRSVLSFCGKRLAAIDAGLVVPTTLEALTSNLTNLKTAVDTFVAGGDVVQLNNANGAADAILNNLAVVLSPTTVDDLTSLSESAARYYTTLQQNLKEAQAFQQSLSAKANTNEQRIAAIETTLTNEQQRLSALITEYQTQFSTAQDKRASDFSASQNEQLTKFTAAFNELQAQFSTAQNTRETAFSEFQRASSDKVAALVTDANAQLSTSNQHYEEVLTANSKSYEDRLGELQKEYSDKAVEILALMEKNKKDVENLLGVIGNMAVTSGYQKTANSAKRMMFFWQFLTSISLVGLISVAILTAFPSLGPEGNHGALSAVSTQSPSPPSVSGTTRNSDGMKAENKMESKTVSSLSEPVTENAFYHGLATRIFLALTFGIFAGYAGRQASHFMGIERKNRKLALELEALGPFIEPLSADEKSQFRIQVGQRSFGVPEKEEEHKGDDPVTVLDLLKSKELRDALLDLYNKSKKSG